MLRYNVVKKLYITVYFTALFNHIYRSGNFSYCIHTSATVAQHLLL